jgi:hypothetical protein
MCGLILERRILDKILYEVHSTDIIDEIIGDHQCGFCHNRSNTDQIFCIYDILEKKWEYNERVHQLIMDFKKACDSVRREAL